MGYNPFMPSYPYIEECRAKLQEFIEFGGSDNEENIRPAFQNCLDAYCRDHRERLVLIPELKTSPSNKPDGTVKDSLRMARGYWEAKDSHDDLDAEIQAKFNRGYPRDNIIFEDSQTAVLVQNRNEAMRVDMSRDGELHRFIRIFLDAEADNPGYQEAAASATPRSRLTMPSSCSPTPCLPSTHPYVPDCDAVYAQAMAAGATSVARARRPVLRRSPGPPRRPPRQPVVHLHPHRRPHPRPDRRAHRVHGRGLVSDSVEIRRESHALQDQPLQEN